MLKSVQVILADFFDYSPKPRRVRCAQPTHKESFFIFRKIKIDDKCKRIEIQWWENVYTYPQDFYLSFALGLCSFSFSIKASIFHNQRWILSSETESETLINGWKSCVIFAVNFSSSDAFYLRDDMFLFLFVHSFFSLLLIFFSSSRENCVSVWLQAKHYL